MSEGQNVSAEPALKIAMERLLTGKTAHTDGRLTVANLAREASVSRATAYRCPDVIQAFQKEIKNRNGRQSASTAQRSKIAALNAELAALQTRAREDRRAAEAMINAMAQRIQALTLLAREQERQIADLHDALSRDGVVTPLRKGKFA